MYYCSYNRVHSYCGYSSTCDETMGSYYDIYHYGYVCDTDNGDYNYYDNITASPAVSIQQSSPTPNTVSSEADMSGY